jgi:hypothetical protein
MTPESSNLYQLYGRFVRRDPFVEKATLLFTNAPRGAREINIEWLLRHHRMKAIELPWELDVREGVDRLLAFYSRVELAVMCGVVTELDSEPLISAREFLGNWHVRRFYESHYPLLLPEAFRLRLVGNQRPDTVATTNGWRTFSQLLDINSTIEDDVDTSIFLKLLDDFWWGSFGFEEFADSLAEPARVGRAFMDEGTTLCDRAIRGARIFMMFCTRLDRLLARTEDEVLRSAMWHYHSYWFLLAAEKVGKRLDLMLRRFRDWGTDTAVETSDFEAVMARLLQPSAGAAYREYVERMRAGIA